MCDTFSTIWAAATVLSEHYSLEQTSLSIEIRNHKTQLRRGESTENNRCKLRDLSHLIIGILTTSLILQVSWPTLDFS